MRIFYRKLTDEKKQKDQDQKDIQDAIPLLGPQAEKIKDRQARIPATIVAIDNQLKHVAAQIPDAQQVIPPMDKQAFAAMLFYQEHADLRHQLTEHVPNNDQIKQIKQWQKTAVGQPGYFTWHQLHEELMQRKLRRLEEEKELNTALKDIQRLSDEKNGLSTYYQRLSLKTPQERAIDAGRAKSLTKISDEAQQAQEIVKLPTNANELASLGDDLDKSDPQLDKAIKEVNRMLAQMTDIADALAARPNCEELKKEYHQVLNSLNEKTRNLLTKLATYRVESKDWYGPNKDLSSALKARKNYDLFYDQLINLVARLNKRPSAVATALAKLKGELLPNVPLTPAEADIKLSTDEAHIFVYNNSGEREIYYNPNTHKPLAISNAAFDRALAKFEGKVTYDTRIGSSVRNFLHKKFPRLFDHEAATAVYQFGSPAAKQQFLALVVQEAMLEQQEKNKDRQAPAANAAQVRVQPGLENLDDNKKDMNVDLVPMEIDDEKHDNPNTVGSPSLSLS